MSKQVISLEIKDRSLTKLAGNSYGRKLFDAQVDGRIDLNEPFTNRLFGVFVYPGVLWENLY